jgi:alpha,alpha-trehalase
MKYGSSITEERIKIFIADNWKECVRIQKEDKDDIIGLPFPFTVPCRKKDMQIFFYWDTYFINWGLINLKYKELAKNNADNLLHLAGRFGFVPNGNRTFFLNRSQPPNLSMIIRDIYEEFNDKDWLLKAYPLLEKEYSFWMTKRISDSGLNRYFTHADKSGIIDFLESEMTGRLKHDPSSDCEKYSMGINWLAEAESGWDFTPRFEECCSDFNQVDLNCNLYLYEINFAFFSNVLKLNEEEKWLERAEKRKKLINKLCWNEDQGIFLDYNYKEKRHSKVKSLASFHPLWAGLASKEQALSTIKYLNLFENEYGLTACEKGNSKYVYQWDYPNGWPPLHFVAIEGLKKYGFLDDAVRIAGKFINVICRNFEQTGDLWEKYNVVDGSLKVQDEYKMPAMMGWTAAVFVYFEELLLYTGK